ncbi:MAG: hypothetical protein M1833_003511 [Piccolia ochrophora]|nr:MAG: hypothetical protein M1833_003511 [Piccolia ochrophora]
MEGLSTALQHSLQRPLSQIYSDTKRSYDTVTEAPKVDVSPELSSLHRKLRIQKARLITWGFEWSDTDAAQPGDIDESLEREGLSGVVQNVMSNIQDMLQEAEQLRLTEKIGPEMGGISEGKRGEKGAIKDHWTTSDMSQCEDLLHDLTASIDTLHDLSRTRRQIRPPPGKANTSSKPPHYMLNVIPSGGSQEDASGSKESKASQSLPSSGRKSSRMEPSFCIDASSLILSEQTFDPSSRPPPYESVATPSNSRTMGYIKRRGAPNPWARDQGTADLMPVLIEYAHFDPIYSKTGISPSMSRLESLAEALHQTEGNTKPAGFRVLDMLGYFEDPRDNRYGLVYDLPSAVFSGTQGTDKSLSSMAPVTLLSLLQAGAAPGHSFVPNLEDRYHLAHNLVATFLQLHGKSIHHRDVTSSNVVFFKTEKPPGSESSKNNNCDIRNPFLCSFDVFSECDLEARAGAHIYRHPDDTRHQEKSGYRSSFDIYALGLILLEIGLWMPINSFWKAGKYDIQMFKSRIQGIYAKKLGPKCGSTYMRAVEQCLSAPDQERAMSQRGVSVDMQWILYCDVVKRLERCCAIDDSEAVPIQFPTLADDSSAVSTRAEMSASPAPRDEKLRRDPSSMTDLTLVPTTSIEEAALPTLSAQVSESSALNTKTQTPRSKLRVHAVYIPTEQVQMWHRVLLPRLEHILEKTLKDPAETFTIDLLSVGETRTSAKPTIIVTTPSAGKVKSILKRNFKYDRSIFDLKVRKGRLRRSSAMKSRRRRALPRRSAKNRNIPDEDSSKLPDENPLHQMRPLCGASIGAYVNDLHLPAVSFGGVVAIDEKPYGMTVHHILDNPSSDDESDYEIEDAPIRSGASRRLTQSIPGPVNDGATSPVRYDTDDEAYISDYSASEYEEDMGWVVEEVPSDDEQESGEEDGDVPGVAEGEGNHLFITQPAIDDVGENFFPFEDDKDEEHFDSHRLGCIHASSGIRRWKREDIKHEIDWALVEIDPNRLQPHNVVPGGKRFCRAKSEYQPKLLDSDLRTADYAPEEDFYPSQVARADELGGLKVHSVGRTSGLQTGTISQAMSSMRVTGRTTASRSWSVVGNFGIAGDSGAWVIDNEQGKVCGHVLAWCSRNCWAYICPMEVLLEDMQRTLSAQEVKLPGGEPVSVLKERDSQPCETRDIERGRSAPSTLPELGKLSLMSPSEGESPERARAYDRSSPSNSPVVNGRRQMALEGLMMSASAAGA